MDWAAPDVSTSPVAPAPAPAARPAPDRRPPEAASARPLGPSTVPDILDGAFGLLRRAPGTILAFTAIFVVPAELLSAFLVRNVAGVGDISAVFEGGDSSLFASEQADNGDTWTSILATLPSSLALVLVAAGLTRLVSAWQTGSDLTLGELLRGLRKPLGPLLGAFVLIKLAEGAGFIMCFLPALAVMTWFLVTVPAIAAEGLGATDGMRRSARLTGRRFWPVLGIGLLSALVATFFGFAVEVVPAFVLEVADVRSQRWVWAGLSSSVTALLTTPVVAGVAVLTYLDLRVRTEGLDLELDAVSAFPSPA